MATPNSGNPANKNSGYTSFMQPGNSPENFRTTYGSDFLGRNMVTAPQPGGPIFRITEGGNLPRTWTTPADRGSNTNRVAGVIGKVGDYLGNVARSARDVPTAVGTALDSRGSMARGERFAQTNPKATPAQVKAMSTQPIKNLGNQIGQVAKSIAGKKDTSRSDQYFGKDNTYLEVNDSTGSWSKLEDGPKPFRGRK